MVGIAFFPSENADAPYVGRIVMAESLYHSSYWGKSKLIRDLRAQLEQAVIRDLLGPANGPEEIVDERDSMNWGRSRVCSDRPRLKPWGYNGDAR